MFQVNVPALTSYPMAAAAVLVCAAVLTVNVSRSPNLESGATVVTQQAAVPVAAAINDDTSWSLSTPVAMRSLSSKPIRMPNPTAQTRGHAASTPRYVLDSTPVSYEASLRF